MSDTTKLILAVVVAVVVVAVIISLFLNARKRRELEHRRFEAGGSTSTHRSCRRAPTGRR